MLTRDKEITTVKDTVLITGGAGFIGSHLANELLTAGYRVRALDALCAQVHGGNARRPSYLNRDVELVRGDIRDRTIVERALDRVAFVVHLAALVGVGQSMYQIADYTSVNNEGTAVLLECLLKKPVKKLVVASSMSIYGEGLYQTADGMVVERASRSIEQLRRHEWEVCSEDGEPLEPLPTPEWKTPNLASVYALSKFDQEQLCLITGRAYNIPTVALRFFNVYGPNQALSNPYTGVLAIFASRLLNNQPPVIFEDGHQIRDFVSVYDIAHACRLALEKDVSGMAVNIGSCEPHSIREIAELAADALNAPLPPDICGKFRVGDVRHCFPDLSLARDVLGYGPRVTLRQGLLDLATWLERETAPDHFCEMQVELAGRGLLG
jgi:dTDP-L-rhamnose 4-epimerase